LRLPDSQIAAALLKPTMRRKLFVFSVGLVLSITLRPILITGPLNAAQQKDAKQNPAKKTDDIKKEAEPYPPTPPDKSPYTGEETRKNAQDNIAIQRNIATSNASVAQDTKRLADDTANLAKYTRWLVIIGFMIGLLQAAILLGGTAAQVWVIRNQNRNLVAINRPFLHITGMKIREQNEWFFELTVKNYGNTPAVIRNWLPIATAGLLPNADAIRKEVTTISETPNLRWILSVAPNAQECLKSSIANLDNASSVYGFVVYSEPFPFGRWFRFWHPGRERTHCSRYGAKFNSITNTLHRENVESFYNELD
jgi:hypothetical protein